MVAQLVLAREIYVARVPSDPDRVAVGYLLANAGLLERYGYWDEARIRYARVIDAEPADELAALARAGIVRMAMALGDAAEVARVAGH